MKIKLAPLILATVLAASSAFVAGCGGGGGETAPTPGPGAAPVFDVQGVVSAMLQNPATFDMTGTVPASQTGSTDVALHEVDTFVPGAPSDPRVGAAAATQLIRKADPLSVSIGSTAPRSGTETYYYTTAPFRLVAHTRADGVFERLTVTADLPSAARIGDSGAYATVIQDQSAAVDSLYWRVEAAETPDTAWVCLAFGYRQISLSQCVRTDTRGAILGARVVNSGALMGLTADLRSPPPSR